MRSKACVGGPTAAQAIAAAANSAPRRMVTVVRTLPPRRRFPTLGARLSTVKHSANRCQTEPATLRKKIVNQRYGLLTEAASAQVRNLDRVSSLFARPHRQRGLG